MTKRGWGLIAAAAGLAAGLVGIAKAQETKPAAEVSPVMKKLGILVGGRWVTEFKNAKGEPFGEFRFQWSEDGTAIQSTGTLGVGTARPTQVKCTLGWDPAAKKVYYLDQHGTQTVYFGHVTLDGDALVYEFKSVVGRPSTWLMREVYPDENTHRAEMWEIVDGKRSEKPHVVQLKRVP